MIVYALIYICLAVVFSIIGGILCPINLAGGIVIVLVGVLPLIGFIIFSVIKRLKEKRKNEEFNTWLKSQNFKICDITKDFLFDSETSRWCVRYQREIFGFDEIVKAYVCKNASKTWKSTRTSNGNSHSYSSWGKSSRTGNRKSSSEITRTSKDTSTYGVEIETNNIANPILTIYCGRDPSAARKICATIKIMKDKLQPIDEASTTG